MNYRLQLFRLSGLREAEDSSLQKNALRISPSEWKDPEFFRSWMVYEFDLEPGDPSGRINWNTVLGLSLAFSIGAGFWTAAGLLIAYLW
jgi:hypothetical protein